MQNFGILGVPNPMYIWVHRDSNPGSSPCKGDVITNWTMDPSKLQFKMHLNFENYTK